MFKDTSVSQASIYASLMFSSVNKKFNAEVGGRLNVHSRYGSNHTYTFNPTYKINDHYRIFGSIASGFKAPSIYQVYDKSVGNRNLKAEKSVNYEIGFSEQHKKVSSRLVYFYRTIKDGVDFNYITFKYFNFVKQIVRGLEYEIKLQPVAKLDITANYTFLSSTETTQSRETFKDTSYSYLLRRPRHNLNLMIGYQFTQGLFANVTGKYVGNRNDVGGYKKSDVALEDYYIIGVYAEYKMKKQFKFFIDAQNITNNKFFDIRGYNATPFIINGGITFTL
jgi:vitamin B12 transporter